MAATTKVLKYQTLVDYVRRQLQQQELQPGDQVASLAEMQARFGVSRATIEKAYDILEQEGLVVREQGSGTFVAHPRKAKATITIGLLVHTHAEADDPYWMPLLAGVREAAREHNFAVTWLYDEERIERGDIDGILMYQSELEAAALRLPSGMPCVSALVPVSNMSNVRANDFEGAKIAVQHLLGLGHRRIGCLLSSNYDGFSRSRLAGYRSALHEFGIIPDNQWIRYVQDRSPKRYLVKGEESMRLWLDESWNGLQCTALLAPNDEAAIGIMKVLRETGLRVPEDISIVGFDGTIVSEYSTPQLTTIRVPLHEIGKRAVNVLAGQIKGRDGKEVSSELEQDMFPVELVVRESTASVLQTKAI